MWKAAFAAGVTALSAVRGHGAGEPGRSEMGPRAGELSQGRGRWQCCQAIRASPGSSSSDSKMPAGYRIPAHHHPTDEYVTVVSGDLQPGHGRQARPGEGQSGWEPGGFAMAPQGMNHFAWTEGRGGGAGERRGPVRPGLRQPGGRPEAEIARALRRGASLDAATGVLRGDTHQFPDLPPLGGSVAPRVRASAGPRTGSGDEGGLARVPPSGRFAACLPPEGGELSGANSAPALAGARYFTLRSRLAFTRRRRALSLMKPAASRWS